ncbi:hypothetical protein QBC39DRAFT_328534 [Podospora conica]|nr:hypothetical protein QBC39DRAFT_328534 [Schizothecium conicum]
MRSTLVSLAVFGAVVAASQQGSTTSKVFEDEDLDEVCESSTLSKTQKPTSFPGHPTGGHGYSTSTIYSTTVYTVTKCPATVTKCPAESVHLTTEVIVVGTTLCPVSSAPYVSGSKPEVTPAPVVPSGGSAAKPTGVPVTAGAGRIGVPAAAAAGLLALLL